MSSLSDWFTDNHGSCIMKSATGMDCPGCGGQRSFSALLAGDFATAWELFPPIFPVVLTVLVILTGLIFRFPHYQRTIKYAAYVTFAFIFVNYVVKVVNGDLYG